MDQTENGEIKTSGYSKRTQFAYEEIKKFGNTPPLKDKSRLNEHLGNISNKNSTIAGVAIEYTGHIAVEYGANLVILCGALPELKKALLSDNPNLVRKSAITIGKIAYSGGINDVVEADCSEILFSIIKSTQHRRFEKDAAAMALGYIMSCASETDV